jgi:hypothetical protein
MVSDDNLSYVLDHFKLTSEIRNKFDWLFPANQR